MPRNLVEIAAVVDPSGAKGGLSEVRKQFKRTSDRAKRSGRSMRDSMLSVEKAIAALKGGLIALAGGFLIRSVGSFITDITEADDAVLKISQRLGIAVDKLSALQIAAELSGVGANTLNMALQRMTRRTAEAAQGTGEAKAAIEELGLSAEALNRMAPDEQLRAIADALMGVEGQSDRVRLAFKLFDSEGVALLQMLENGTSGLDAMTEAARQTGAVLDEDAARAAAEFNDTLELLGVTWTGLRREVLQQILPHLITGMEKLTEIVREHKALIAGDVFRPFRIGALHAALAVVELLIPLEQLFRAFSYIPGLGGAFGTAADIIAAYAAATTSGLETKLDLEYNAVFDAQAAEAAGNKGGGPAGWSDAELEAEARRRGFATDDEVVIQQTAVPPNTTSVQVVAVVDDSGAVSRFQSPEATRQWTEARLIPAMREAERRGMLPGAR